MTGFPSYKDTALRLAQEVDTLCEQRIERNAEIKRLREALRQCASSAGHPDAAEGCRVIIRIVREALPGDAA